MKKTQKILSLVVVMALALSVCCMSASAASIQLTTSTENYLTASFDTDGAITTSTQFYNEAGTQTGKVNAATSKANVADGILTVGDGAGGSSRILIEAVAAPTTGKYVTTFSFKVHGNGEGVKVNNTTIFGTTVTGTIYAHDPQSNGKPSIWFNNARQYDITPDQWYDFKAVIDLDAGTYAFLINETEVKTGTFTANTAQARIFDYNGAVTGTISYDNLVINKVVETVIEDGVTNVMYEDFSSKTSINTSTKFYDAAGTTAFNTTSQACTAVSVENGTMLVGTRYILNPETAITSGKYTVSFDFKVPAVETGANTYVFSAQDGAGTTGFATYIHYPNADGRGHIWVDNASAMAVTPEQWYAYDATFDFATKEYVVTIDDQVVQSGAFTAAQFTRLFHAGQNNGHAIYYDNIVINKLTKDYEVMNVTKANSKITARFVSNAAPKATFFAAIYENGALTSLKAIADTTNLAEREVGSYTAADEDVEVKFFVWAKNGLMPLAD